MAAAVEHSTVESPTAGLSMAESMAAESLMVESTAASSMVESTAVESMAASSTVESTATVLFRAFLVPLTETHTSQSSAVAQATSAMHCMVVATQDFRIRASEDSVMLVQLSVDSVLTSALVQPSVSAVQSERHRYLPAVQLS